jgi:hypothetical protein
MGSVATRHENVRQRSQLIAHSDLAERLSSNVGLHEMARCVSILALALAMALLAGHTADGNRKAN